MKRIIKQLPYNELNKRDSFLDTIYIVGAG